MREMDANQKQESGKIKKAYESNLRKLTALLSGEAYFKTPKAGPTDVAAAIAELAKEEKEAMTKNIVAEARKIIQEKRTFDKFVNQQKKEMDKKVEGEQKLFNEKCKSLWGMIADVGQLEKSYYETLKGGAPVELPTDEKKDEEEDE